MSTTPKLEQVELAFPFKGLHESSGIAQQPDGTSPQAVNVRGYDLVAGRDRGCQRVGLSKAVAARQTTDPVALLAAGYIGAQATDAELWADVFSTKADGSYTLAFPNLYADVTDPDYVAYHYHISGHKAYNAYLELKSFSKSTYTVSFDIDVGTQAFGGQALAFVTIVLGDDGEFTNSPTGNFRTLQIGGFKGVAGTASGVSWEFDGSFTGDSIVSGKSSFATNWVASETLTVTLDVTPTSITVTAGTHGSVVIPTPINAGSYEIATDEAGIIAFNFGFATVDYGLFYNLSVHATETDYDLYAEKIAYGQTGDIYIGDTLDGFAKASGTLTPSAHYHDGNELSLCFAGGYFYVADGTNALRRVKADTGVITEPAATAGSLPAGARLLWLFRDRLFHGRFAADPYNYYASKAGDFLDYDASDRTQVGSFAGNNTQQAGLLGDILTAAIPYGDVSCVMGMANSIAVMRGDPKSGGSIDTVSREVGIVRPSAWARDPDGNLYFMSRDGLYAMQPGGGTPKPMSRGRLDTTLGAIDHSATKVVMEWDPQEHGVKIFLVPADATLATTAVFWEQRKDAFWVDSYPAGKGPTAVVGIRGPSGGRRTVLWGCWDGYLRSLDATVRTDDGDTISSLVRYTPRAFFGDMINAKIENTRLLWGTNANHGSVYKLYTGNDALDAALASAARSKTLTLGGYQSLDRERSRGACGILEISNAVANKSWAIEAATLVVSPSGRVRT